MLAEIWKDIEGFEGLYQVSNHGKIKPLTKGRTKIRKVTNGHKSGVGYFCYTLRSETSVQRVYVHRLVAMAFVNNPHGYTVVNHIDGIKTNNHFTNIEWCTPAQNNLHAYRIGIKKPCIGVGERHPSSKLTNSEVIDIKSRLAKRETGVRIAQDYGLHPSTISCIRRKLTWNYL